MSYAPPAIPAYTDAEDFRFPHTVLVRRAHADDDTYDEVIAELRCRIYRAKQRVFEAGFGKVIEGPHKLICNWADAHGHVNDEADTVRELDEVVHRHDGVTDVYVVTSTYNPANANYNLECELELRQPGNA